MTCDVIARKTGLWEDTVEAAGKDIWVGNRTCLSKKRHSDMIRCIRGGMATDKERHLFWYDMKVA